MYTRFFGLTRLPFEASPGPGFLFDGPAHREAIASIEYAVAMRMGFIMLMGEVGLGMTTVVQPAAAPEPTPLLQPARQPTRADVRAPPVDLSSAVFRDTPYMGPLIDPDAGETSVSSDRWRLGLEQFPVG
jgi:hypothetical protein